MTTLKTLYLLILLVVLVSCDPINRDSVNNDSPQKIVTRFRRLSEAENDSAMKNSLMHSTLKGDDHDDLPNESDEMPASERLKRSSKSFKKGGGVAKGGGGCKKGRK
ncbi:uncharacterized protein LOC123320168 [Coccinella septempunctata]|uniref:uncharacterized protein LOC123320168 n=1 Tax=Coccinella septempunctata TaxID=41139 RepID=UPI001D06C695|nr:uncharacterized protein LOC123320168 [Coccinella septempunctata]